MNGSSSRGDGPSPVGRERVAEGRVGDREVALERGLEASRTLALCLSAAALGSDWVGLEPSTIWRARQGLGGFRAWRHPLKPHLSPVYQSPAPKLAEKALF